MPRVTLMAPGTPPVIEKALRIQERCFAQLCRWLKPGVTVPQANAEVSPIEPGWSKLKSALRAAEPGKQVVEIDGVLNRERGQGLLAVAERGVGDEQALLLARPLGELLRPEFKQQIARALGHRGLVIVVGRLGDLEHPSGPMPLGVRVPVHDHVAESGPVEQGRGQHHERVEPAAGLIQSLRNEIGRKVLFEMLLVLERIVRLGIWHGAALEPAVQHLGDPAEQAAPFAPVYHLGQQVDRLTAQGERWLIETSKGVSIDARAVIIASGTKQQTMKVPGEKEYMMKGLCYSALSYAPLFIDRTVVVVGATFSPTRITPSHKAASVAGRTGTQ